MPIPNLLTRKFPPMTESEQNRGDSHMRSVYVAYPCEGSGWVNVGCGYWTRRYARSESGADTLYAAFYNTETELLSVYRLVNAVPRP